MDALNKLYVSVFGSEPDGMTLLPLSGSARKYYRISGNGRTVIGVAGTNAAENNAFVTIDRQMAAKGINVPEVLAVSPDGMFYLQDDLGDNQLFEFLKPSIASGKYGPEAMRLLHKTIESLPSIQFRTGEGLDWGICFPDREFNRRMVNFDLNYFKYDFLKFTGMEFNEIKLQDDFDRLVEDSLEGIGETFMYRDFQSRNVMIKDGEPYFIDFQGGRRGPIQYDLASFLWNAGTHFSKEIRDELIDVYMDALAEYQKADKDEFLEKFRLISLVRLLQEFGAYGFRGIFERKQIFLDCLQPAKGCLHELVQEPFKRYPYLTEVLRRVADEWVPEV